MVAPLGRLHHAGQDARFEGPMGSAQQIPNGGVDLAEGLPETRVVVVLDRVVSPEWGRSYLFRSRPI